METYEIVMMVFFLAVFFLVPFFIYFNKIKRKETMFYWMQSIYKDDLYHSVRYQQTHIKSHDKECILIHDNEQEKACAKEILEMFLEDSISWYFNGGHYPDMKLYKLDSKEHLMFSLWCYLSAVDREPYIPSPLKYKIEDDSICLTAYYKLYYTATKFCENNWCTQKDYRISSSEDIKDRLYRHLNRKES
jgi:hypothetical protein